MAATARPWRAIPRAMIVVLICGSTACSGTASKPGTPKPTIPPSMSAAPDPRVQAQLDAVAAYSGMWADMAKAGRTANWKDSALTHHATDRALTQVVQVLYDEQRRGLVSRGAPVLHPEVVQLVPTDNPNSAQIKDCGDSTNWPEVDSKTGALSGSAAGGRRLILAQVVRAQGLWRVTDFTIGKIGSCQ